MISRPPFIGWLTLGIFLAVLAAVLLLSGCAAPESTKPDLAQLFLHELRHCAGENHDSNGRWNRASPLPIKHGEVVEVTFKTLDEIQSQQGVLENYKAQAVSFHSEKLCAVWLPTEGR